ncbi:error-prone DNA polymerase [Jannaschia sp. W003]|uniref:error-prone DNA polymerase n=1 Tax=Jannaschia sp. W003 TaxID=2867012 RepID=UPI0021A72FBC|nr:error-prone DNA polymerase [Jannaschia sp. W003]UWQ20727.1 error-prone DNA polymerase [Jannaschia sp. W003]
MPDVEGPEKRTLSAANGFRPNARAPFVEFGLASAFSFLRGASDACDLMGTANALGYDALGIADRNTLAGVVRMHVEGKTAHVRALVGCRLVLTCGAELLAYPGDRAAYGRLASLLSRGKMRTPEGAWQGKDVTEITPAMLAEHAEGLHLVAMPGADLDAFARALPALRRALPLSHLGAARLWHGDDRARINRLDALARAEGLALLATGDVLYHHPARRPLQDVMSCIREGTTVDAAGPLLERNAERHLRAPAEMARLFAEWPHAVAANRALADRIAFTLDDLRYEYPHEVVPRGRTPQEELERLTWEGARGRYPDGIPEHVERTIHKEFALIRSKRIATYFLTIHDIVDFARRRVDPPILCQGRGSAANSAVCFCLGVTSVDPAEHDVLFERFLSEDRDEPPDIDIDFEHERREEVIQYVYAKYGRARAGLCATVIHYRPRSAIREVGKAMGLTEDVTSKLASTVWGHFGSGVGDARVREAGLDLHDPYLRRVLALAHEMIGMPRHLSQHVGGFILTETPLTEIVPVGNGAMPDRSFIEWDKDDIDALGIFKVDVLALGMLTCLAKGFALLRRHCGIDLDLATVPKEHDRPDRPGNRPTYDMLCRGESLGVFQVESRAQMAMLPKLRPRSFYDLVIEVAIVRPGPIQGDMVHPYLRRRQGQESIVYPAPGAQHPQDELQRILGRTLGVPIFQEQAMKIAMVAAEFSGPEANALRKAMATFRHKGMVSGHKEMMIERMTGRGYDAEFAARCFSQIEGFGEYGFPESHAASFAKLVYVSSWMKCHHPAIFACALLNSQPMGFYAPAQIVRDARENGVEVRAVDIHASGWDCSLEGEGLALRLGLRQVDGMREDAARRIVAARAARPFADADDLRRRAELDAGTMRRLAEADAMGARGRRDAMWDAMGQGPAETAAVFDAAGAPDQGVDVPVTLPPMPLPEAVVADYQTTRLSLKAHPMRFFRRSLAAQGYVPAAALPGRGHGARVRVAGLVLVRQKPGSAKGVCFVTLEDETGVINLVIWKDAFERFRPVIMRARLMAVEGTVQTDDRVIHVVAARVEDRSDALGRLADTEAGAALPPTTTRGDHPTNPIPHQVERLPAGRTVACTDNARRHPRDVRVVPPSRDFH